MPLDNNIYRVLLNSDWQLADLYTFPHAFSQTYAFVYCLDSELDPRDRDRINTALTNYPWKGGYSYVNIYTVLQNQVPPPERPKIYSIQKSSPGWLDLILNVDVAIQVAKSVGVLLGTAAAATKTYSSIQKNLSDLNVHRHKNNLQNTKLTQAEIKTMMSMSNDIAKHLGFKNVVHQTFPWVT
ncbi:MAG: hypothetical protein EPO42_00125 [Gallionellaceae bacterium]|nr:MAG: hypothetical protein EPO42_00125 [Gallionellaceae bacterium]